MFGWLTVTLEPCAVSFFQIEEMAVDGAQKYQRPERGTPPL
jgi:hypothetical protein